MEKKRYYVSVQAQTVNDIQGASAYEFEIDATEQEVQQLMELFTEQAEEDKTNILRLHNPRVVKDETATNEGYDYFLTEVYKKIYELGTPETKDHIASMDVLDGIQHGIK